MSTEKKRPTGRKESPKAHAPDGNDTKGTDSQHGDKQKWTSPAAVTGIAALVVSIGGNLIQYAKAQNDMKQASASLEFQAEKWRTEMEKIKAELIPLKRREQVIEKHLDELEKTNKAIQTWENAIFMSERDLSRHRFDLSINSQLGPGRSESIKAIESSIEITQDAIAAQKQELSKLLVRRKELEALIH